MTAIALLILLSQDSLQDLLQRLDSPDIAEREKAVRRLMERELADLPALEKAYRESRDAERRARLRRALAGVRRKRHAELLRDLAASSSREDGEAGQALAKPDAREVLRLLRNRGSDLVNRTIHALLDLYREDEEVVREALREKPASWPPEFAPRAVPFVSDPDAEVSRSALRALSRLALKPPLPGVDARELASRVAAIAAKAGHPCREAALESLAALGDERSVEAIVGALGDPMPELQALGLKTLRAYLERRPALSHHARAAEPLLASTTVDVRRLAYEALAVHPAAGRDLPRVREALRREAPQARWGALELAAALGDASLAGEIARVLPEKDGAKAAEALFRLGPACAAEHLAACFERQAVMTEEWIEYLARHAAPEPLEPLRLGLSPVVERGDSKARASALRLAGSLDAWFDAETVAAAAKSEDDFDRKRAFERIATARTPAAVEVLRGGLRDKDGWVRREAVKAAGRAKAVECRDDLLAAVGDKDLLDEASEALGLLGDRSVLPRLLPHVRTNRRAREAVGRLGTANDAGPLIELAREAVQDRHEIVALAATLLGDRAVETFRPLIQDRRLRAAALEVLAGRGATECAPEAARHLSDSDPRAVRAAANLMGQARHAEAVPRLLELLLESDVRGAAAEALVRMPREQVAPKVAPLLRSRDASLRETAARLLFELDADELVAEAKEVLGDDAPRVARHGVAMVRRRKLKGHLGEVELLSRRPEGWLRREALETLAEVDWAGSRKKLLERLEEALPEIAPLFGARNDEAALPLLLRDDASYDALVALNSYRKPAAYARAAEPKLAGIGTIWGDSLEEKARRLSRDAGIAVRVEVPPPPPPRASFEAAFGSGGSGFSIRAGGGGGRFGSGTYSLLQKLRTGLGTKVVPVLEDDAVRLLSRDQALEFWAGWARKRPN